MSESFAENKSVVKDVHSAAQRTERPQVCILSADTDLMPSSPSPRCVLIEESDVVCR
jgi:hypothetical protein